jgi:hypothetical protein
VDRRHHRPKQRAPTKIAAAQRADSERFYIVLAVQLTNRPR